MAAAAREKQVLSQVRQLAHCPGLWRPADKHLYVLMTACCQIQQVEKLL